MIVFDTNVKRGKQLKKAVKQTGVTIQYVDTDGLCIAALESIVDTNTILLGSYSEYLVHWIISMQPAVRNIIIYTESHKDEMMKLFIAAKYAVNYVPFDTMIERLI